MLSLYDYQEAILDKLRQGFAQGHKAQILYCPTGGGKTEMAISMMEAADKLYNRSAMILDRIVLCNQTSARLDKYGIDHGVMQSGHWRYRPFERIQICSAQTLEKRGTLPGMKLLIVDEAHQTRQQTIEFIKNNPDVKVVGLTATPFTKGLGTVYSNVVSAITTAELVEQGRLAPLRVFVAKEIDMEGAKKVAGEWSTGEVTTRGIKITGDIVSEWVKTTNEVFGRPVKTIVFAAGVAHAQDLAEKFCAAGYNFLSLSYRDDDQFKADAIEEFSKADSEIMGLIATDILTKGFDVPDVFCGISARPFKKSLSSHIQQMGRVMRSCEGKEFAIWLDHSGNYLRFREEWDDVYYNGVSTLKDDMEKPKPEPTKKQKKDAVCPRCHALWIGRTDTCANCGFVRAPVNQVVNVSGEVQELSEAKVKHDKQTKQSWLSQLMHYSRSKGYQDGWYKHKFREKFGVWPKDLMHEPMPVSLEVSGWIKSQQIAYAHRRK